MTEFWSLLGIEPTDDLVAIKRAYVTKLKVTHPEDDPEGFQRLRAAYEAVVEEVKYNQLRRREDEARDIEQDGYAVTHEEFPADAHTEICTTSSVENHEPEPTQELDIPTALAIEFLHEAAALYDNIHSRVDVSRWSSLLDDDRFIGIETRQILEYELLRMLTERSWAPGAVWRLLDESFQWSSMTTWLEKHFPEAYLYHFYRQLKAYWDLNYDFIAKCELDDETVENFLSLRGRAQITLIHNDYERSEHYLLEAAKLIPNEPDLCRLLGQYWMQQGQWDEVLRILRGMDASAEDTDYYNELAYALYKTGNYEEARHAYNIILNHEPDHSQALTGLAQCLTELKQDIEAINTYLHIMKHCPWDMHALHEMIVLSSQLESILTQIKPSPELFELLSEIVEAYQGMDLFQDAAIEILSYLEKQGTLNVRQNYLYGHILHQAERYDEAAHYYKAAVQEQGLDNGFRLELLLATARNAYFLGDYEFSLILFEQVLELEPTHDEALYYKAEALRKSERYEEAIDIYKNALEQLDHRLYHAGIADCYYNLRRYTESSFHFNSAELDDTNDPVYFLEYGEVLLNTGKHRECIDMLDIALEKRNFYYAYYFKGTAHYRLEEYELCRANMREFLSYESEDLQLYANLFIGNSSMYLREWETAVAAYRELLKHLEGVEDSCAFVKFYAASLLASRRFDEAIDPLERILKLEENNEWALLQLVRVFVELQNWNNIDNSLQKMIDNSADKYINHIAEDDRNPYVWFYCGIFMYYTNMYDKAKIFLQAAYNSGLRGDTSSYYSLVLYGLGDQETGLEVARSAVKAYPNHPDYVRRLKYMEEHYSKRGKLLNRLGMNPYSYLKETTMHFDFPDVLDDEALRIEFPGEVIVNE
ncbi:tetratricopeptide repeat protein [Paenibacillus lutimineralis]|uniref:Tetratricopeptide repeat protein n=1 Tax=Paenibacillus lutimineralis TaxID=2707005 RepID=A0A3S9UZA1_9BACL|nr:tetratricopeptide repeat protein [Paenibacillus lutimineralis]AZS15638.1 tetratricopeptide repeat protein [Paenibacillus lutimineralis]